MGHEGNNFGAAHGASGRWGPCLAFKKLFGENTIGIVFFVKAGCSLARRMEF